MLLEISAHYQDFLDDIHGDWTLEFADLNGKSYDIDSQSQKLIIHNFGLRNDRFMTSPYFKPQVLLNVIEGLRMTRHMEMLDGVINRFAPNQIMVLGRVCTADVMMHKIAFAWQEKLDGDNTLWKHILCGELSDMATSFITVMEKLLSTGHDESVAFKKAMAAGFNQWFSSQDRQKDCDHNTLNMIDDMIMNHEMFQSQSLQHHIITYVTVLAGEDDSYLDKALTKDILENPYYALCHDPINQTHFMQMMKDMNKFHVDGLVFQDKDLASRFLH